MCKAKRRKRKQTDANAKLCITLSRNVQIALNSIRLIGKEMISCCLFWRVTLTNLEELSFLTVLAFPKAEGGKSKLDTKKTLNSMQIMLIYVNLFVVNT